MSHPTIEIVVPYGARNAASHLAERGDYATYCGRNREGWSVVGPAHLPTALDSPWTCKRCVAALLR